MDWNIRSAIRIYPPQTYVGGCTHDRSYIPTHVLFLYRDVDKHTYCKLCIQLLFLASISLCMLLYTCLLHGDNYVNISIGCSSKLRVHYPMYILSWNGVGFLTTRSSTYVSIMSFVGVQPSPWLLNN